MFFLGMGVGVFVGMLIDWFGVGWFVDEGFECLLLVFFLVLIICICLLMIFSLFCFWFFCFYELSFKCFLINIGEFLLRYLLVILVVWF